MRFFKTVFVILVMGFMALPVAQSAPSLALPAGVVSPGIETGTLLHRVDTFPTCAKVKSCWRTDYGQLRCGFTTRCQVCKFVRRCNRAQGCRWVEKCTWGPPRPVLKSN